MFRRDGGPAETVHGRQDGAVDPSSGAGHSRPSGRTEPWTTSQASTPRDAVRRTARRFKKPLSRPGFGIDDILSPMRPPGSAPTQDRTPIRFDSEPPGGDRYPARRVGSPLRQAGPECPAPEAHGVHPAALPGTGAAVTCSGSAKVASGNSSSGTRRRYGSCHREGRLRQHAPVVTRTAWPIPHTMATR